MPQDRLPDAPMAERLAQLEIAFEGLEFVDVLDLLKNWNPEFVKFVRETNEARRDKQVVEV
jgi:hypothetical protein